jgi:hypothetical protein
MLDQTSALVLLQIMVGEERVEWEKAFKGDRVGD